MRINLFGNLRISFGGSAVTAVNSNPRQSLIAYLVLNSDAPQPRERLAFLLWPASSDSQARTKGSKTLTPLLAARTAAMRRLLQESE